MGINYNPSKWENGKTVIKASHFEKIEKGITDIINYNNSIYTDEDRRKENEIKREEEHNKKIKEVDALVDDLKSDYDALEKIIIDENASANLQNQINDVTSQLEHKANEIYIEEFVGNTDTDKIKNAINSISDTGTIKLKNKTYNFNAFVLKEGINLIGSGNTIINSQGDGILIKATNKNIISDLTINDNGYSIKTIDVGQIGGTGKNYCNNSTINNVTINLSNVASSGIRLGNGENNKVLNSTIINYATIGDGESSGTGIAIYSDNPNTCKNIFVSNNYVKGFYYGIAPWGTGTRINVQVNGNIVEDCVDIGINMYHATLSQVLNNNVYNCKVGIFADTVAYNNNKGRGTIVSNNSVHKCTKIGIYCEELRAGVVSNNTVQDCGIGVYAGASTCYTLFSNNTVSFNTTGLMFSNQYVPTQMQNYDNHTNIIKSNIVACNKEHGILLEGIRGLWDVSDNFIASNNTSNGDFYAIYFDRDIIEDIGRDRACESVDIKNNTIYNGSIDGTTGYQGGIYNASGTAGVITLLNNRLQNKNTELYLTGFSPQYSVIKDNVVTSTSTVTVPNCKIVNNIGIEEGNVVATANKGIRLNLGVANKDSLPTASASENGRIIRVNRRSDDGSTYIDDEFYICVRLANGKFDWKKISLI